MLGEFADYATLGLKRRTTEAYRRDVLRRQEQERLAYDLHDTAVRGLLEIGFTAEQGCDAASGGSDVRSNLASIAAAAERCMEALRGRLDELLDSASERTASEVLQEIAEASLRPDGRHRFHVHGPDSMLPDAVADALVRIGQEALVNVDLHAGNSAEVGLEMTTDECVLTVADVGPEARTNATGSAGRPEHAHLGLRAMQRAADRVRGQVERVSLPGSGGLLVRATVPTRNPS